MTIVLIITVFAISYAFAQEERVKLTGYIIDDACAPKYVNEKPVEAIKCAAVYKKDCTPKENCAKFLPGMFYGIYADSKRYSFSLGSNKLVKSFLAKNSKKDHLRVTITGRMMNHMFLVVESITEAD